jgi:hypothetical protein
MRLSDLQILSVAWWVPLVKQELLTLPYHLSSRCCSIFNFLCSVLSTIVCFFPPFLLAILLSSLLQFRDSDYPLGIFKLLLSFLTNFTGVIGSTFSSGVEDREFDSVGGSKQRLWHYYFFSTNHRALLKNRKDRLGGSKDECQCGSTYLPVLSLS